MMYTALGSFLDRKLMSAYFVKFINLLKFIVEGNVDTQASAIFSVVFS